MGDKEEGVEGDEKGIIQKVGGQMGDKQPLLPQ